MRKTGMEIVDINGGMGTNGLVGVVSYSGCGKTTYLLESFVKCARQGASCGFISRELNRKDLIGKIVGIYIGKDISRGLPDNESNELRERRDEVNGFINNKIFAVSKNDLTIKDVEKALQEESLDSLYIDGFTELLKGDNLNALKMLAERFNVRIFISMNLKRTSAGRKDAKDVTLRDICTVRPEKFVLFDNVVSITRRGRTRELEVRELINNSRVYRFENTNLPVTFGDLLK